ncbi:hypothetical protein TNCV_133741 [Trichonephila clavipes]|nr:hypothetical protein TNCV_133741 [Trichonephila clavipes]
MVGFGAIYFFSSDRDFHPEKIRGVGRGLPYVTSLDSTNITLQWRWNASPDLRPCHQSRWPMHLPYVTAGAKDGEGSIYYKSYSPSPEYSRDATLSF